MGKATKEKSKKKSIGIQEMREDGTFEEAVAQPEPPKPDNKKVTKKKKTGPAVKKGFLNNNSKSLYPEGSSEGQNGGAYTRLMSRCTVVDTANMQQQQGGGGPPPAPPAQVPGTTKQAPPPLPTQTNPFSDQASSAPVETRQQVEEEIEETSSSHPPLSINEQNEIDKMFSGLDDDFASSLSKEQKSKEPDDFMTQQFADFAKALTGPNGPNREKDVGLDNFMKEMTNKTPKDEVKSENESVAVTEKQLTPKVTCKVNNKLPKHITTNVEISDGTGGAQKKELRITVNNVDKSQLKQTDLQVSEKKVMIVVPSNDSVNADGVANSGGSVQVIPPFLCNVKTVKAAMSKKKKNIEIIVSEC